MKILPVSNFGYRQQTKTIDFGKSNSNNESMEILKNEIKFNTKIIKSMREKIKDLNKKLENINDSYTKIVINTQIEALQSNINDLINTNTNLGEKVRYNEFLKKN